MKTLFELVASGLSKLNVAKYLSLFGDDFYAVEQVLEIQRRIDREKINKEFASSTTRNKWWEHLSFFDEEDDSPRWIRFVRGKVFRMLTRGMGKMGKRKRKLKHEHYVQLVDYYGFRAVNNEITQVDDFFDDQSFVSLLYDGELFGHIRSVSRSGHEFLF